MVPLGAGMVKTIDVSLVGGANTFCPAGPAGQLKVVATTPGRKTFETWEYDAGGAADRDHKELVPLVAADTRGGPGSYQGPAGPPPLFVPTDPSTLFAAEIARGVRVVVRPD